MIGAVPQTSLIWGRKRVTLGCALSGRSSSITEEPLSPELLKSPTVTCTSGHEVKLKVVWASLGSMFHVCDHLHVDYSSS